ncbi:DRMBL-domain-containing protein [Ramaria rubella]|nr:DRMBL-domain-containing protein [Ramaria rubella]
MSEPPSTVQDPVPPLVASLPRPLKSASAFSVLMSSHKENNAWKEASEAENKRGNMRGRRPAPFYKVMQGMPIAVDAFRYGKIPGVTAYFLTHAHSDHYTNLSSSWKNGPIYCSQSTANLIIHMLDVDPKWVFPLPLDTPTVVPNTGGVVVTLIQANHCPGSVLFLFKGQQTVNAGDSTFDSASVGSPRVFRYLHCGDFRACPQHVLHSEVKGKRIDIVYLDTTYLDSKYCFPPQPLVISACAELARRIVQGNASDETNTQSHRGVLRDWVQASNKGKEKAKENSKEQRTLVVVGTYTIGKERIVKAIAKALSTKVYCDLRKTAVLKCLSDTELHDMLTNDPFDAGVHIVPLHMINSDKFQDYLSKWNGRWTKAVGFRPTGWTYTSPAGTDTLPSIPHIISRDQARTFTHANLRPMRNSTPTLMLYGVPYSEHSSFFELTCFALSFNWGKMIATVNVGNATSRGKMEKWFEKWQTERIKRAKPGGEQEIVQYRRADYW